MAGEDSRTWIWHFDSPRERVWPLLADTARFNEAARLPSHGIEETPRADGSVLYMASTRKGPFELVWEEKPVNWVTGHWFEHRREFRSGPLASLCAKLVLTPDDAGCKGSYTITAVPANLLGAAILRAGFFEKAGRSFTLLAETANACAAGLRETPFDYRAPALAPGAGERLRERVARIEASGHGHGLTRRLGEHLTSAQEVDLTQIRPLRLARHWGAAPLQVVELCLEATRAGLLELRWDLLCPRCRIAKAVVANLEELPSGTHCGTCNIDYDRDFSRNVELSFRPAPWVRPLGMGEYCLFGPMSTPHIRVHVTVEPGRQRTVEADLALGPYRLRTLEPGPEIEIDWPGGGFPEVIAAGETMAAGSAAPGHRVRLRNDTARPLTFVVEERAWVQDALTADRATSLQAFRDLFSDQVLRPGDEVAVRRVALLFTDLKGSTALYGRIGDAGAYHLVREHFAFLAALVRTHNGAVVKTIGDAIMAAFMEPADALAAAVEMQGTVRGFNARHGDGPVALKLGLHEGPCIAVTLNDRLDYFGSTVNLAARLQGESLGSDIVVSKTLAEDPAVAGLLPGLEVREEQAELKGFEAPVSFLRITFDQIDAPFA
jgi:class 3 adenylate cyclase